MKKVIIAAGGTGGHIFPALALADELSQHNTAVVWMGCSDGLEQTLVQGRYPLVSLPVKGIRGKGVFAKVTAIWKLLMACKQALAVIRQQRPQLVIGMGGFVSGPAGVAAWLLRVPLFIHEQNSVAGYTNRILSRLASQVFTAFPKAFASCKQVSLVGNPVRRDLANLPAPSERLVNRTGPLRLLVLGGSRGARVINRLVMGLASHCKELELTIWHQTGSLDYVEVNQFYATIDAAPKVEPFIDNMSEAYAWADLVVARAGALTVAEIAAVGVASVLIPYPYAVDDHQYHNAMWLAAHQAAIVIRESALDDDMFIQTIKALIQDRTTLVTMAECARAQALTAATEQLSQACLNVIGVDVRQSKELDLANVRKVHCIGIGGIGVSALARYFKAQGCVVQGSDMTRSSITDALTEVGIKVYFEHAKEQVADCDLVIYSSAIHPDNDEWVVAKQKGIPTVKRGECLAAILKSYNTIAVAGTHGKTTTTGLVAWFLQQQGLDVNYFIGGMLQGTNSPLHLGDSPYFVVESDESDASFLSLRPTIAVVTNIDNDHLQTYDGKLSCLQDAFVTFLNRLPTEGVAIVCIDDPILKQIISRLTCRVITVGFSDEADIKAFAYRQQGLQASLQVDFSGEVVLPLQLNLAGQHNVTNALAAMAVLHHMHCFDQTKLAMACENFPGVNRRLQLRATLPMPAGDVLMLEDYGHHPAAVAATMRAIRAAWPGQRLVMVFQPHRYTRTAQLKHEFVATLVAADVLLLLDIYTAGEQRTAEYEEDSLLSALIQVAAPVYSVAGVAALSTQLASLIQPRDVIVFQGAGSVGVMLKTVAAQLQAELVTV